MKLLLDTHVVLWWQRDDRRLNQAAREAIATADIVWVSAVSGWEVAIKTALGRLRLDEPFHVLIQADDFTELPLTLAHGTTLAGLAPHHTDPFDRVLVAQALAEGATVVTHDRAFAPYGVPVTLDLSAHMLITRLPRPLSCALVIAMCAVPLHAQEQTPTWPRETETPSAPKPAPPPADWLGLIGEYESAPTAAGKAVHLYVIEREGRLMAIADRGEAVAIDSVTPKPEFTRDAGGRATRLTMRGTPYARLQVGPEGGSGQLRVAPLRPVAEALKEAQAAKPPAEDGSFLPADLVELTKLDADDQARRPLRDDQQLPRLGLLCRGARVPAAARRRRRGPCPQALAPLGYGLLVHDGYRPWYVTKTFWDTTPPDKKWLVANPAQGSRHNRGAAVDLTLYDLRTGAVIEMPSTYDESTPRAYAFYPGGTSLQRWHRALLRRVMEAEGFAVNPEEWWHFDFNDWRRYAIGNIAFDRIR